jgi:hypothetical protein
MMQCRKLGRGETASSTMTTCSIETLPTGMVDWASSPLAQAGIAYDGRVGRLAQAGSIVGAVRRHLQAFHHREGRLAALRPAARKQPHLEADVANRRGGWAASNSGMIPGEALTARWPIYSMTSGWILLAGSLLRHRRCLRLLLLHLNEHQLDLAQLQAVLIAKWVAVHLPPVHKRAVPAAQVV